MYCIHYSFAGKKTMKNLVNTLLGKDHKNFMFGHKDHKVSKAFIVDSISLPWAKYLNEALGLQDLTLERVTGFMSRPHV